MTNGEPAPKKVPKRRVPSVRSFAAAGVASIVAVFSVLAFRVHEGDDPAIASTKVTNNATTTTTTSSSSDDTSSDPYNYSDDSGSTGSDDSSSSSAQSDDSSSSSGSVSSTPQASTSAS
jgi:hypothetical protein